MKLLKSILFVSCIMSTTLSCAQWGKGKKIRGNGEVTTENRSLGSYEGVKVSGSMDIKLIEGSEGNISIEGESNLMEYIETKISYNNLIIKVKDGINLKPTRDLTVTVPYESIELVSLAGSGDISNTGTIKSTEFEASLAGSGDIDLKVSTDYLETNIAGSGDIELKGSSGNLVSSIAGSGDFDGNDLECKNVEVRISGSGTAKVHCTGNLKARVSGSGDVIYKGNPKSKDTKVSGSGRITN